MRLTIGSKRPNEAPEYARRLRDTAAANPSKGNVNPTLYDQGFCHQNPDTVMIRRKPKTRLKDLRAINAGNPKCHQGSTLGLDKDGKTPRSASRWMKD